MEYIPYEGKEDVTGLIPRAEDVKVVPPSVASEKAFYTSAMFSPNPEEDYYNVKDGLEQEGEHELNTHAENTWTGEQQATHRQVLESVVADPNIPVEQKKRAVMQHALGLDVSQNLRDRYMQKTATEDNAVTEADRDSRDYWLNTLHGVRTDLEADKATVEKLKTAVGLSFSGTLLDAFGGIAADFVPGRYGLATANAEFATLTKGMPLTSRGWEYLKSFVLPGEANNKMNKMYNDMTDEGKAQFIRDIGDAMEKTPGFDYNSWQTFRDAVETPDGMNPIFRHVENIAGVLDVMALKGFIPLALANGVFKTVKNTLKYWTTYTPMGVKQSGMLADANPRTGSATETNTQPATLRSGRTGSPLSSEDYLNIQRLKVAPMSPAGTTASVNLKKGREMYTAAVIDDGKLANAMGTNKAEILADSLFPKLDADVLLHPDIAKDIRKVDEYFAQVHQDTQFDPFLVNVTQRDIDKEKLVETFKEHKGAHYQQANSIIEESVDNISGTAVFGRNADYGFIGKEQAEKAAKEIGDDAFVVHNNGMWYVHKPFSMDYNPYETLAMGVDTVTAKFAGLNADKVARSKLGDWLFLPTQRMNPNVPEGAALANFKSAKIEADYKSIIEREIKSVTHPAHLENELNLVQEGQQWSKYSDISTRLAAQGLKKNEIDSVFRGYSFYKRLLDYQYAQANRVDRNAKQIDGQKAIYGKNGEFVNYGKEIALADARSADTIFDFDIGAAIAKPSDLQGRTLVKISDPINLEGKVYDVGILGADKTLHSLPAYTLPRIEGYIPRKNIENFYVTKTPKSMTLNGVSVGKDELAKFTKTIGAGATKADADALAAKLAREYPDHALAVKAERSDADTSIITDHKVYNEMLEHSRKRGERLPTLYGKARLENPLEALWGSVQSTVRLDVWRDYESVFRKNWVKNYGEFTKGQFPQVLTDIKAHAAMNTEDVKQWKAAQRYFEQFTNQKYKITVGDELWKNSLHNIADAVDNVAPKYITQALRDYAGKGNLIIRAPRALVSSLFLHLNPARQWTVQTQQLLEWSAIDKNYLKLSPAQIPGIITAIMSRASMVGRDAEAMYAAGWKISGMKKQEFDETLKAIYDSGLPHSVDLNMMLHGAFHEAKQGLTKTTVEQATSFVGNVVKSPAILGKAIGYSPAELANTVGTWLFTRERFKRLNPGVNWNTPENIARITADAWEIGGSMSTRAGNMPYQDGALGLFFQFQRIGHAKFMDVFSSKVFSPTERAQLATARALMWGTKGIPAAGLATYIISEHTDSLTQEEWRKFEGGFADLIANNVIDTWLRKPGEKASDLAISSSLTSIPETLPYLDFIIAMKKAINDGEGLRSFPFVGGMGRLNKAAHEISTIWSLNEEGQTTDSLKMSMYEVAKLASGVNNYDKAMYMREMDDKANSFGTNLGIQTTRAQVVAQMFGIISKEEEHLYLIKDSLKERNDFIERRAQEIHLDLNKHAKRFGDPSYTDWVKQQRTLLSYTPESVRREIEARVDSLQLKQYEATKESAYTTILNNIGAEEDKWINKAMGVLGVSTNPKDKEIVRRVMEAQKIMRNNDGNSE